MIKSNIILIGMPGAGKSTIGSKLAHRISKSYLDTDELIVKSEKRPLQNIIDTDGYLVLRQIEEDILLQINYTDYVISTGGSAAYSRKAMLHLKKNGIITFLNVDLEILQKRLINFESRGVAKKADQTLEELFIERHTLYLEYSEITINTSYMNSSQTIDAIIKEIHNYNFLNT